MSKIQFLHSFEDIISLDNLLEAWKEFVAGKRSRKDVQEFERNLMSNVISLHYDLTHHTYAHGKYQAFNICDPKPRIIHKATVRDRLVHHAIYRILYPFFERTFIADSFSCQIDKGTHKAMNRLRGFVYQVSKNNTQTCWILKCDVKKFFANINQIFLKKILSSYVPDKNILWLISQVINSFSSTKPGIGLPLGNLTSQLFVNIYMNEFDQFVKHKLKAKHYIRFADDFLVLSQDKKWLETMLHRIKEFLRDKLHLRLHRDKISIQTIASGLDFLGWVHFSDHRVLRTATKRRMFRGIKAKQGKMEAVQSYLGLLKHGNAFKLRRKII